MGNYCDAALIADVKGNKTIYRHPQYFYIGHFSKFVLRDSVRVDTTTSIGGAACVSTLLCANVTNVPLHRYAA